MLNLIPKTRWNRTIVLFAISLAIALTILGVSVLPVQAGDLRYGGVSQFSNGGSAHGGGLPAVNGGIPGLNGFRFNFKSGDHHINTVAATYDTRIAESGCEGSWCVMYFDQNRDDAYWYDLGWQELPVGAIYQLSGITLNNNTTVYKLGAATPGTTPVLTGFRLMLQNGSTDMHLGNISVRVYTENGSVYAYAWFKDNGGSNTRRAFISYAEIPNAHIQTKPIISGRSSGKEVGGSLSAQHPVLQGFGMRFWGDHHIDRLGAQVAPGSWRITFEDEKPDDMYDYWLYWADLIP